MSVKLDNMIVPMIGSDFNIVTATAKDLPPFVTLLDEVGAWLWDKGFKQWAPGSHREQREELKHLVENGCLVLAYQEDILAGGCILTTIASDLWAMKPSNAIYLNSMAVARFAAGSGLSTDILAYADYVAQKRGQACIRLDCWDGNDFLKAFYLRHGYAMLEAVQEDEAQIRLFEKMI